MQIHLPTDRDFEKLGLDMGDRGNIPAYLEGMPQCEMCGSFSVLVKTEFHDVEGFAMETYKCDCQNCDYRWVE